MVQCKYKYRTMSEDYRCSREALQSSSKGYCILHEDWEHKNPEETKKAFYKEIEEGKTDIRGCILPGIDPLTKQPRKPYLVKQQSVICRDVAKNFQNAEKFL